MKADLYNIENSKVGTVELPETIFGASWRPSLVKQVLVAQMANRRLPWAHAKDRSEVRGGGKKPWRQKGTGRARHGSIRSPLWVGGGKAHGPRNDRDYTQKVNKKMKRNAVLSVLSHKYKNGEIKFMENLVLPEVKTKVLAQTLLKFAPETAKSKAKNFNALLVPETGSNIYRAARNLPKVKALSPESLNVYDLMNYKNILLDQKAVAIIEKHYSLTK